MVFLLSLIMVFSLAAAIELALHYFPWEQLLGRPLMPPWSYVAGLLPLALIFTLWSFWWAGATVLQALLAFWVTISGGGLAVILAYGLDHILKQRQR